MAKIVEYPIGSGGAILIEVMDEEIQKGLKTVSRKGKTVQLAEEEFEKAIQSVKSVAKIVKDSFADLESQHLEVAFGVKLNGGLNAIITAGVEANFNVTLTWDKK